MQHAAAGSIRVYRFENFRLIPSQDRLYEGDVPVAVGSRALAILAVLVERSGDVVSKNDLMAKVWPGIFVEEANLRVHITALRRLLGGTGPVSHYIANVPGRGYRFMPRVSVTEMPAESAAQAVELPSQRDYPRLGTRLVGRGETVAALTRELAQRRWVTVTGSGGIGKTSVALAVADAALQTYPDGVRFIDFAALTDVEAVPGAVLSALGVSGAGEKTIAAIIAVLRPKRMLLILDNCEHLRDAAGELALALFNGAPQTGLLVTSREPLRIEGERVFRLQPLAMPPLEGAKDADLSVYAAVELFIERANERAQVESSDLPLIAEICRRLDGIPLAIELAAGQVEVFGVRGLAALLEEKFALVMRDKRRALPRHRTLLETLDWSFENLPPQEQALLLELAIFAGPFEAADVRAVALCGRSANVLDDLACLIDKSLVAISMGEERVTYRLLETTRAYAREKLEAAEVYPTIARRHAEYYASLLDSILAQRDGLTPVQWTRAHGHVLDNIHAALQWALTEATAAELGVAMTLKVLALWHRLSLLEDCRRYVELALQRVPAGDARNARPRMILLQALGQTVPATLGVGREVESWWREAYGIAEQLGDRENQVRSLVGLWATQCYTANYQEALVTAERFRVQTGSDADECVADRMVGTVLHVLGDQTKALAHLERSLTYYDKPAVPGANVRFLLDQKLLSQGALASVQWLCGQADRSWELIRKAMESALAEPHAFTLCNLLAHYACPLGLFTGNLDAALRYTALLLEQTDSHGLEVWRRWALAFEALLGLHKNFTPEGFAAYEQAMGNLPPNNAHPRYKVLLWSYGWAMGRAGASDKAIRLLDGMRADLQGNGELWCVPEVMRMKADVLTGLGNSLAAEALLEEAMALARKQGALAWELKAAITLSRLLLAQGRRKEAATALEERVRLFTEGWGTGDMRDAKTLLEMLAG
ncbi:putative ATPase/DNA-binding winged helix-turn-helix (wHTH) protein [Rhizomicrobium palustre]|uniref:Putative ATPase/DNA-binding winged helix-turn-helix (WHTH) protein n=1 Tax=Rhizomicrobium palustre TaxID=189966 RepID=A0A846MU72_9PROT|nr:winged helix-turn-helix domain-containing protein [Rhizomicrobium palustre]NIK86779.1 putative ATPase/DNA-binding winged helix-turn-helix (wHTH) protein [Rhizomicrobium palustre]